MKIPESFALAYDEQLAVIQPLQELASTRLRLLAVDSGWLFDDRIKTPESCLSKIETGKVQLSHMQDMYAAMIVVPTQGEIELARTEILKLFAGRAKATKTDEVTSFVYDDLHIIASLQGMISPVAVPHRSVLEREFEIQIHTGVQYAWWGATHDYFYKGKLLGVGSRAADRASRQAFAVLELVDGVMANFTAAAGLQHDKWQNPIEDAPFELLNRWPTRSRPKDEVRFAQTVRGLCADVAVNLCDVDEIFDGEVLRSLLGNSGVTPIQCVAVACHIAAGEEFFVRLGAAGRRVLVTQELLESYPPFVGMPEHLQIIL